MAFLISNILQDYPILSGHDSGCDSPDTAHHEHSNAVIAAGTPAFVDECHDDVEAGDILPLLKELLKNA